MNLDTLATKLQCTFDSYIESATDMKWLDLNTNTVSNKPYKPILLKNQKTKQKPKYNIKRNPVVMVYLAKNIFFNIKVFKNLNMQSKH